MVEEAVEEVVEEVVGEVEEGVEEELEEVESVSAEAEEQVHTKDDVDCAVHQPI